MSALKNKRGAGLSIVAVLTLILGLIGMNAGVAFATGGGSSQLDPAKAAVCKYVGKPNADERLQTGNNPIVVDRKADMVIGTFFQDAQGRSVVIAFLNPGDPEPDVSQCPAPDGPPPPPTKTPVTAADGQFIDLCGTTFNLQFRSAVTEGVAYLETRNGNTITVRAQVTDADKYVLTNPDWTQSETDTLTPCEEPPPAKTPVTAVDGKFDDSCGPVYNLSFTPAVTEGVHYVEVREGNTLTVHAEVTDADKYELTNPDWSNSKTDELVPCGAPPPPVLKTLNPFDFAVTCGKLTGVYPKSNPEGVLMYGSRDLPEPDNTPEVVRPGQKITIKTTRSVLDIMIWVDGYEPLVWSNVKVPQNCGTVTPPKHPKPPVVVHPHPVVHHNPAPWTPPTKQRTSGGNTGIDTAVVSQTSAPSLGLPIGITVVTIMLMVGIGLVVRRRRTPAPAYEGRHVAPKKA